MSEFRIKYVNQKAQYVKKIFEIGIPVPSEALSMAGKVMEIVKDSNETEDPKKKKKLKKKGQDTSKGEKIDPGSVAMIAAAVLLAAARGTSSS